MSDSSSFVDVDDYEFVPSPGSLGNLASLFGSNMTVPGNVSLNYRAPVQPAKPKPKTQAKAELVVTAVVMARSCRNGSWTDHGKVGVAISSSQEIKQLILYRTQIEVLTQVVLNESLVMVSTGRGFYSFLSDNVKYAFVCSNSAKNHRLWKEIKNTGVVIKIEKFADEQKRYELLNAGKLIVSHDILKSMDKSRGFKAEVNSTGVRNEAAAKVEVNVESTSSAKVEVGSEAAAKEICSTAEADVENKAAAKVEATVEPTSTAGAGVGSEAEAVIKAKTEKSEAGMDEAAEPRALKQSIDSLHAKLDGLLADKTDPCKNCHMCNFTRDYERQLNEPTHEYDFYSYLTNKITEELKQNGAELTKQKYELKADGTGSKLLQRIVKECVARSEETPDQRKAYGQKYAQFAGMVLRNAGDMYSDFLNSHPYEMSSKEYILEDLRESVNIYAYKLMMDVNRFQLHELLRNPVDEDKVAEPGASRWANRRLDPRVYPDSFSFPSSALNPETNNDFVTPVEMENGMDPRLKHRVRELYEYPRM